MSLSTTKHVRAIARLEVEARITECLAALRDLRTQINSLADVDCLPDDVLVDIFLALLPPFEFSGKINNTSSSSSTSSSSNPSDSSDSNSEAGWDQESKSDSEANWDQESKSNSPDLFTDLTVATHVCQRWRNVARNTAILWTHIVIDERASRVSMMLDLSRQASLRVQIEGCYRSQPSLSLLRPHISRIRSLILSETSYDNEDEERSFREMYLERSPVASDNAHCQGANLPTAAVIKLPCLSQVYLGSVHLNDSLALFRGAPRVSRIRIGDRGVLELNNIVAILRTIPNAVSLRIEGMSCHSQPGVQPCPVVLNELQSLSILSSWTGADHLLGIIVAPRAASLFIQCNSAFSELPISRGNLGQGIREFFNDRQCDRDMSISLLPGLQTFSLSDVAFRIETAQWQFECCSVDVKEVPLCLDALQPVIVDVQNLHLHVHPRCHGQLATSTISNLSLPTKIFQASTNLNTITISSFDAAFVISLLQTWFSTADPNFLPNLHELSLHNIQHIPAPIRCRGYSIQDPTSIVETLITVFRAWKNIGRALPTLRLRECYGVKGEDSVRLSRITGGTVVITWFA
ncbi:unnamed protein product [Somion occarium]|uniref:F-box domain-containing protein n=1 Tax=Somion occarium TaxID=3059160 RepID=A0ABP1E4K5_9APHY